MFKNSYYQDVDEFFFAAAGRKVLAGFAERMENRSFRFRFIPVTIKNYQKLHVNCWAGQKVSA